MDTLWLSVDSRQPDDATIRRAADALRRGDVVAVPTETVYGLAADALDAQAVAKIYVAKGRPSRNPLIVHVLGIDEAKELASHWPAAAQLLAERFWPGPLTIVVPKRSTVPDVVTGGGATVAIRCPAHPVMRAILRESGRPLAAPSANLSNHVSSTTAEHVRRTLDGRIAVIVDGGPAAGGLESTVVDATRDPLRVLRPGLISLEQLQDVLGTRRVSPVSRDAGRETSAPLTSSADAPLPAPGMLSRHYAPRVPLECVADSESRVRQWLEQSTRIGWITWLPLRGEPREFSRAVRLELPADVAGYSARLYQALHDLEAAGVERIVVESPPADAGWEAVRDRLLRAAAPEATD